MARWRSVRRRLARGLCGCWGERMRKRVFDLVGESFANADRTYRQEILNQCFPGDPIILVRQPENIHDKNAILATTVQGEGLGHISREDALILSPILDSGRQCRARIHELRGGIQGFETLGCRIAIAFENEDFKPHFTLKPEQIAFRKRAVSNSTGCFSLVAMIWFIPLVAMWFK